MSFLLNSPITGDVGNGSTTGSYSLTVDTPPNNNGKQWAITAIANAQSGVHAHSVGKPFTVSVFRPAVPRVLPPANPITGLRKGSPNNTYKVITRKGVLVSALDNPSVCRLTTTMDIPAGSDAYDSNSIAAALLVHINAIAQNLGATAYNPGGLIDSLKSGLI